MFQTTSQPHSHPFVHNTDNTDSVRITKVKKSMDNLYQLIQSAKSMINKGHNPQETKANFHRHYKNEDQRAIDKKILSHHPQSKIQKTDPEVSIDISPVSNKYIKEVNKTQSNYHIKINDKNCDSSIDLSISINHENNQPPAYFNRYSKQGLTAKTNDFGNTQKYRSANSNILHESPKFQPLALSGSRQRQFIIPTQYQNKIIFTPTSSQIKTQRQQRLNISQQQSQRRFSPQVYDYINQFEQSVSKNSRKYQYKPNDETLQKKIQYQLQEEERFQNPPTMMQIPLSKPNKQDSVYRNYPVTPRNYQKLKYEQFTAESEKIMPKTVRINLQNQIKKSDQQLDDTFVINKQKYLHRLKNEQFQRTSYLKRIKTNRSYSGKNRYSLSPECSRITNRLFQTKTNKQPCSRYQKYKIGQRRMEMKQVLGNYDFIRRYMTDNEINDIMTELQMNGVPQNKWPMKIIDVVYSKLRFMKRS